MPSTKYTSSTAITYLLLGEGPMRLKNGLNSIYLNKTPISNSSVASANLGRDAVVYLNATGTGLTTGFATIGITGTFPLLLKGAGKIATGSIAAGTNVLTTTTSFFTSDMLASDSEGDGGLYQRVRIPGAGPGGSELAAEVLEIVSATQAILDLQAYEAATSVLVTWDHFTYAVEQNIFGTNSVIFDTPVPRVDLRASGTDPNAWPRMLATIGNGSYGFGSNSGSTNFDNVKVNFRPGTLDQLPVINSVGFSGASSGVQLGTNISQIDTIDNGGSTVFVHNNKITSWWGGKGNAGPVIQPTTPATSATTIISGAGSGGLNVANPGEIDEIIVSLSFPNGLNAFKAKDNAYGVSGCVFQIYFDYKVATAPGFQSKLMFGPSSAEVASRTQGYFVHDTGDLAPGWTTTGTVRSNSTSSFNQDFRFSVNELKPFDEFRVRIIKLTPDSYNVNGWQCTCNSVVNSCQAFINDKFTYPYSAYLALEFNSQEFQGNFPDIAAHCYGIECDIPKNYVTREEALDGVATYTRNGSGAITSTYYPWNGTFRRAYTNNPVWIIRELLLNRRYGLGNWLSYDQIDDYALYSLSRYCDELVPDGEGGLEPRFTCGAYLTQATEAYKVIKDFFTTMLSIPYWIDGKLTAIGDRPAMPIYTFSKANVENGMFMYEGTGNKVRPNQIAVSYNDRDYFYERRIEIVDDIDDIINNSRVLTEEVVAFGATSRGQATRYGRWKMLTAKMQKDLVSFKTADNAIFLRPGDVISVQDADKNRVRYSGRVVSGTTTSVVLDSGIDLNSGDVYTIHLLVAGPASYLVQKTATISSTTYSFGDPLPIYTRQEAEDLVDDNGDKVTVQFSEDSHLETRTITNSPGLNQSTITVSAAFSDVPMTEFMWAITVKDSSGATIAGSAKDFRILSITEEGNGLYGIIAAEHYNSKFDLINEDYLLEPTRDSPRYGSIPAPRDFTAGVQLSLGGSDSSNSAIIARINLAWKTPLRIVSGIEQAVSNLDSYILKYVTPEGTSVEVSIPSSSTSYSISNPIMGTYTFTLQSKSIEGPVSAPARAEVIVQLDTITPGLASQLKLLRGGEFTRPPILDADTVDMAQDYDYTSPLGTRTKVRNGIL